MSEKLIKILKSMHSPRLVVVVYVFQVLHFIHFFLSLFLSSYRFSSLLFLFLFPSYSLKFWHIPKQTKSQVEIWGLILDLRLFDLKLDFLLVLMLKL